MNNIEKLKALLVIVTGLSILYLIFDAKPFIYVAVGIGTASLLIPGIGTLIVKIWFKISEILGWFTSKVLLSVVFFLFLLPVSILWRLFSKNPLNLKSRNKNTIFSDRNHQYTKSDLENIW